MIQFLTVIAWFCILIAVVLGVAQTLITLAMYLIILGLVLLFGAHLYPRK